MFESFSIKDLVAMGTGIMGSLLGLFNLWQGMKKESVRLKVLPKAVFEQDDGHILTSYKLSPNVPDRSPEYVGIEVINLSTFPVTISDVGFTTTGTIDKNVRRSIPQPVMFDEGCWPRRLEARSSVTFHVRFEQLDSEINKAYAETECGHTAYGKSDVLWWMRKLLAN